MSLPLDGWKNKRGTEDRNCQCGSWKNHWLKFSGKSWPGKCATSGCNNAVKLEVHIYKTSSHVTGKYIVPACDSCDKRTNRFNLKISAILVPANK